jgi:hypothetical protein
MFAKLQGQKCPEVRYMQLNAGVGVGPRAR